jgi:hypothetical protein
MGMLKEEICEEENKYEALDGRKVCHFDDQ